MRYPFINEFTNNKFLIVTTAVSMLTLSGCEAVSNQQIGAGIGTVAGGVLGNQIGSGSGRYAATALGAMIGGWIGTSIGYQLDKQDYANDNYYDDAYDYDYQRKSPSVGNNNLNNNLIVLQDGTVYDPVTRRIVGYSEDSYYQRASYDYSAAGAVEETGWENR